MNLNTGGKGSKIAPIMNSLKNIEEDIWKQSQGQTALSDPKHWLSQANSFHHVVDYIMKDYLISLTQGKAPQGNGDYLFKIFTPFLFLLATTIELYLKGYLVSKGVSMMKVRSYKHNLKTLRLACLSFGDKRFGSGMIQYITDYYGRVLSNDGGLRYPGRKPPPMIFPDYVTVLDELESILNEKL